MSDNKNGSYFDGTGGQLFGYYLLTFLVCTITLGIASPWMICKLYKWRIEHTVIDGKRFSFNGTGGSLLGKWILWELLTIITLGIFGFFTYVAVRKWELEHTYVVGENGSSTFDGTSWGYFGQGFLAGLLTTVTLGFGYPWAMCKIQRWDSEHQIINGRRLKFTGTGGGFFKEYLIIGLLSIITIGFYAPWGIVRLNKYIIEKTNFV